MSKADETPEGRIAHQVVIIMRRVQSEFRYQGSDLLHASFGDFEVGLRPYIHRELKLAWLEALSVPHAEREQRRREIAAELAKLPE